LRVLRTIPPPPGEPEGVRYEIFHDVLAAAILTWRRRQFVWRRIWQTTRWTLGVWAVLSILGAIVVIDRKKAVDLEAQRQALVDKGQAVRENAKLVLARDTDNPLKHVTALRNLSFALNCNPRDTEAAKLASNLLLQHVWCPPAAPAVVYQKDALLAATFVPGGGNNEIFAVGGDGQLLFWNGERSMSPAPGSLFERLNPATPQQIVQAGLASFTPDGRWLLIIPPTLASAADGENAARGSPVQGAPSGPAGGGREPCKIQIWRW